MSIGREIEVAGHRFLARERMPIFLGQDIPATIVRKEIIDNEIDIVGETGQKANKAVIYISPNRLKVMDNGTGISTATKEGSDETSLWHACATMFSSSNYSSNSQDTLGANGVGMTMGNYTSQKFSVMNFNGKDVRGYSFTDGYLNGKEECSVKENGDFVENPLSYDEANQRFSPFFDNGFMVDVIWDQGNDLFVDNVNIPWLVNYAKSRAAEMKSGEIEMRIFEDDDFKKETICNIWSKDTSSPNYLKSWEEQAKADGAVILKEDSWTFALNIKEMKIESMCQSAPIKSRYRHSFSIKIQDYDVSVSVPFTMKYLSSVYPAYTDQTKVAVRFPYSQAARAFERSGEVYKHFYREAEKSYMAQVIKDSTSNTFWPCLGPAEEGELIIAEGFSAISGLKAERDPITQACTALRGKILNCWNLDMVKAMRSDVVKQILNAAINNKFKRVIIAVDADDDGYHILCLLIAMFTRFTNLAQEGRLYYVKTPHYLFKKGKELKWSDDAKDCPPGFDTTTLKGLGGMDAAQIRTFIMDSATRELVRIDYDENSIESLDLAFSGGGESWIINEDGGAAY